MVLLFLYDFLNMSFKFNVSLLFHGFVLMLASLIVYQIPSLACYVFMGILLSTAIRITDFIAIFCYLIRFSSWIIFLLSLLIFLIMKHSFLFVKLFLMCLGNLMLLHYHHYHPFRTQFISYFFFIRLNNFLLTFITLRKD